VTYEKSWDAETQELTLRITELDEEDLRSYLLALREFYADNSEILVININSILYQMVADEEVKSLLARGRAEWNRVRKCYDKVISINDKTLSPEYIYSLYMNGVYFHHDANKIDELSNLSPISRFEVWNEFLNYVIAATDHVLWLSHTLEKIIRDGLISLEPEEANTT
jgi:hypothetical protein